MEKKREELLSEAYRNCQLALESISDILPNVEDEEIREEILKHHEEYEKFSAKAAMLAKNNGLELKEPNAIKKAMMWSSIKLNSMTDGSRSHIAEMMIRGTVMGITALKTSLSDAEAKKDEEIFALVKELVKLEEDFEKRLKEYL